MTTQLLFYERAVPLSKERHADWSLETGIDYSFARNVNAVPLLATEIPAAAAEYAVVFTGSDEAVMPAALLGIRNDENLYLTETGGWNGKYIPAFVRRYPFVFSSGGNGGTFTLCLDEEFSGCNQEGRGQRLFDDDRRATPYLEQILAFTKKFQSQYEPTASFCRKLVDLELLDPMKAQIKSKEGGEMSLGGFMAVNRDRLKALPGDTLSDLAKTNELELLYLQLASMRNMSVMAERMMAGDQAQGSGTAPS
jgi:hypothetical protein